MSAKEKLYELIDNLSEEQINETVIFIREKFVNPPKRKPTPESLCGILHEYARPELIEFEKGAWERDITERILNGDESF